MKIEAFDDKYSQESSDIGSLLPRGMNNLFSDTEVINKLKDLKKEPPIGYCSPPNKKPSKNKSPAKKNVKIESQQKLSKPKKKAVIK